MREGTKPPMTAIRQSVYSLLEKRRKNPHAVNLLGQFAPYDDDCELYALFRSVGLTKIREIGRMRTLDEYMEMGEANFNLVLNPEARYAAEDLMERLGMPYIEMGRFYDPDRIARQYSLLGGALGVRFQDAPYRENAMRTLEAFADRHPGLTFAVGQSINANPFELSDMLLKYGFKVERIFANATESDLPFISRIAEKSPGTRLYTSISPTMLNYRLEGGVDVALGKDAAWYYPDACPVPFMSDVQPFGYSGLMRLLREIDGKITDKEKDS